MKIAMIGHKRIPGREGGIEVVVEELAARLVEKGHDVTVYNRRKHGLKLPKEYRGIHLISIPTIEKKCTDAVIYSLFASIRAIFGHYDVIHYHAIGPSFFIFIPYFFGKKTVVTVHGLNYKTPKWIGLGAWFMKKGEKFITKYANSIIVLSHEQQTYFKKIYNRDTVYIPNGTVVNNYEQAKQIKIKYGLEKNGYILFLSRVVPGKGVEYLIDAYKDIDCDLPLIIAGDTEYVVEFRKMIEKKASKDKRIKLIGFVEGEILRELYSNARLFVFPSEAEGMPMCLLEAMSYNCACLVSDIPENLEIGNGYVQSFISKNKDDLRNKLIYCLKHPEIFNKDSKEFIKKYYSWDKVVNETLKIYKENC